MTDRFRPRNLLTALLLAVAAGALGGCVAYPDGYYGAAYPGYYGYPAATVGIGVGGWGRGRDDDDWGDHDWGGRGWRR